MSAHQPVVRRRTAGSARATILILVALGALCVALVALRWRSGAGPEGLDAAAPQVDPGGTGGAPLPGERTQPERALVQPVAQAPQVEETTASAGAMPIPGPGDDPDGGQEQEIDGDPLAAWKARWPDATVLPAPQWYGARSPLEDAVFEEKYGYLDLADLEQAKEAVTSAYDNELRAAFDKRFQAGEYETHVVPPGRPVRVVPVAPNGPVVEYRHPAKSDQAYVLYLPFDEFTDVYELGDEWNWLTKTVNKKKKGQ